jgi:hypothetical protein
VTWTVVGLAERVSVTSNWMAVCPPTVVVAALPLAHVHPPEAPVNADPSHVKRNSGETVEPWISSFVGLTSLFLKLVIVNDPLEKVSVFSIPAVPIVQVQLFAPWFA